MATTYCPAPLTPPPTPPPDTKSQPDALSSDFPLTDESDAVWLSALRVANSFRESTSSTIYFKVEPQHIALALLYDNIKNIDEVVTLESPILDIPLFWNAIQSAGGDPSLVGQEIRAFSLQMAAQSPPGNEYWTTDIRINSSQKTVELFEAAQSMMQDLHDLFITPQHLVLAILLDAEIAELLEGHGLEINALSDIIRRLRTRRVRNQKAKPRFAVLELFATDLTELARKKEIGPIIGRDHELRRLIVILSRRMKNNAVLLGEPGVGKTAIAEALALRIVNRDIPHNLNARIFSLDMGALIASTACHGKLELRVKAILDEIQENQDNGVPIILFIDDMHLIMTGRITGGTGGMDVANLLKPLLARGKLRCFGATTFDDYKRCIEADGSLIRRFSQIIVCEPTVRETMTILRGLRKNLQEYHGTEIMDGAFVEAAILAHRYVTYRRLPDSAIDIIDEACSALRMNKELKPEVLEKLEKREKVLNIDIRSLEAENDNDSLRRLTFAKEDKKKVEKSLSRERDDHKKEMTRRGNREALRRKIQKIEQKKAELETKAAPRSANKLMDELKKWRRKLDEMNASYVDHPVYPIRITPGLVAQIVAEQTSIPVSGLMSNEKMKYLAVEDALGTTIIGQPEAVRAVSGAVHLSRSGLADPCRPIASFLLTGPSGTGKTFLAKELTTFLFGSTDRLVHINASEYSQPISVTRLIGTPACSGFDQGGQLTECVKRRPFSVVLVDNIEKACQDFIMKFQVIIDQGFLTDGDGKNIDFRNCILLMTTGIGSQYPTSPGEVQEDVRHQIMNELHQFFPSEFLSRLDDIVVFRMLSDRDMFAIIERRIGEIRRQLVEKGVNFVVDGNVTQYLYETASRAHGARDLEREVQTRIKDCLPSIKSSRIGHETRLRLTLLGDKLRVIQE